MGSFIPYPGIKENKLISRMINSVFYFLKFVFILKEGNHYRLVAIEDRKDGLLPCSHKIITSYHEDQIRIRT